MGSKLPRHFWRIPNDRHLYRVAAGLYRDCGSASQIPRLALLWIARIRPRPHAMDPTKLSGSNLNRAGTSQKKWRVWNRDLEALELAEWVVMAQRVLITTRFQ